MKLSIESTDMVVDLDGVECRLWEGRTEAGGSVQVFVHRVGTDDPPAQRALEMALEDRPWPASETATIGRRELIELYADRERLRSIEANKGAYA